MNEKFKRISKRFVNFFLPDILDAAFSFLLSFIGNSIKDRLVRAIIIGILSALGNFFMSGNTVQLPIHDIIHTVTNTK
jgi:hypothetical protein